MGKTAFATNIAFHVASKYKHLVGTENNSKDNDGAVVGFFSLEMSSSQLATRIISEQTSVSSEKIRRGKITNTEYESLIDIAEPSNIFQVLLSQNLIFYIAILLMIFTAYILKKTMFGRRIEAIGEDLKSADSMGLKIAKTQFIATCVGGAFAGLSGVYLTLSYVPYWTDGMTSGRGWIALALVIFGGWKPYRTAFGALLFGFLEALGPRLQTYGFEMSPYIVKITPYLITILVLVFLTIIKNGKTGAPKNIGIPFFRENR